MRDGGKTVEVKGVGPVLFEHSRLAKRIVITVRLSGEVRVAVPCRSTFAQAEAFAGTRAGWIKRQLSKARQVRHCALPAGAAAREKAGKRLIERLAFLAQKHGFKYNRVSVRDQKTRWGSCSSRNNISLNARLAALPGELCDYVILHELTHTRQKDHGMTFWAELDKFVGNGRLLSRRLKGYSLR